MKSASDGRAAWLAQLHSTASADRAHAESAVRKLYAAAGFAEPRHFFWFDSPCAAAWPVTVLVAEGDRALTPLLAPSALPQADRGRPERTRAELQQLFGVSDWKAALAAAGVSRAGSLQAMKDPSRLFSTAFLNARFEGVDDVSALFKVYGDDDDLSRAESHFIGSNHGVLRSAIHCASAATSAIGNSFYNEYSFSTMADDEHRAGDRKPAPLLAAAWEIARTCGLWWPFEHAVFLSERPIELHVNGRKVPHRDDGPAIVYRDGWRVYAWNGKAVYEKWIMEPESVPRREYQGFDPTYKMFAESKARPATTSTKGRKPGTILKVSLPADPAARLDKLRAYAGGPLPLFDRYQAGEHREVWRELVALGPKVREDPHAADALAVAYETMRRVDVNVRTLVQRLTTMNYVFKIDGPPRGPNATNEIVKFEQQFGVLPLSLRVFYEVVGEVNLNGTHPALDPPGNTIAPDPLLVYGLDEGIVEHYGDEDDDTPSAVTIAPDDLHKANTSGGDPYEMMIPDPRADGELVNERHGLFFVDYLRLCFRFGGFPGYEGHDQVPAEVATLSAGLLDF